MNRLADAGVSAAAADVGHGCVNVLVAGLGLFLEQGHSRQHLAALAVTALRHLVLYPGLLHRVQLAFVGQAFDGDDLLAGRRRHRVRAGAHRLAVEQDRAGAALGHAAAEFRAFDIEFITQGPQKGHVGFDVEFVRFSVDFELHESGASNV